jgi:putative SOS response-associated peptidase YedK
MCGRYTLTSAPEALRALFRYEEQPNFPARYNIAPTQPIAIVRLVRDQAEWEPVSRPDRAQNPNVGARSDAKPVPTFADRAPGKRHFALVRWGLLPSWVKDPKTFTLLINARGESAAEKPAFRSAMKRRRCLIPADGFYEWQASGERKRPYFIRAKTGGPLAFAGLWETWTGPNGEELETAAIVTTRANRTLSSIHERMPVVVPPEAFDLWLDGAKIDAQTAAALIAPAREDLLESYEISTAVNRTANDNPKLIEPVVPGQLATAPPPKPAAKRPLARRKGKKDDGQGALF